MKNIKETIEQIEQLRRWDGYPDHERNTLELEDVSFKEFGGKVC